MLGDLLPFIVSGVVAGSVYGLAGLGIVLTYRTSGVFNFGYGAIAAAGAFLFYTLHYTHHVAWPIAALITIVGFAVVVGPALELVTRPLVGMPDAVVIVATVGIMLGVQGYLFKQYGDSTLNFPQFLPTSGFHFAGIEITWSQVISFVIAAVAATGLSLMLKATRRGVAMRAVVDNAVLVRLCGDRPDRIRLVGWAIGSAAAAVSGILLAPLLNLDVTLLTFLVVQALGACAIGRFRSLPLTFAGGLIVGVCASVATKYLSAPPLNGLPTSMPFVVLVVVMVLARRSSLPESRSSLSGLIAPVKTAVSKGVSLPLITAGAAVILLVPFFAGTHLPVWTAAFGFFVLFVSMSLLAWGSGQLSMCHAAFMAVGATSLAHLRAAGIPWFPALILAGLFVVPVGAIVAIPAIRLSGTYFALATLGFGIFMQDVVYGSFLMFGNQAAVTVPRPHLLFIGTDGRSFYYVSLAIAVGCGLAVLLLYRGRFGRLLRAMAEAPTMLWCQGLSVNLTRLLVVCVSAFLAGIAGGLVATQTGEVSGITFASTESLLYIVVLGICGTRLLGSAGLAAVLLGILPGYLKVDVDTQTLAFGLVAIGAALLLSHKDVLRGWLDRAAATSPGPETERRVSWATNARGRGAAHVTVGP